MNKSKDLTEITKLGYNQKYDYDIRNLVREEYTDIISKLCEYVAVLYEYSDNIPADIIAETVSYIELIKEHIGK